MGETPKPPDQHTANVEKTTQAVAFRTLVQSEISYLGVVTVPTLFLPDSAVVAEEFFKKLAGSRPDLKKALRNADITNERILALMFGRTSGGGYAITIREITVRPGAVTIRVQIEGPEPDRPQTMAETDPVHMVAAPRDDLNKAWDGASQVVWTVTDMQDIRLLEVTERRW